jgi:hypothetical protein
METLSGLVAMFDREMVFHKDLTYLGRVRTELIALTLEYGQLNHLELTVGGYDDDPRALYEVPEVNRWVRLAAKSWPDLLFWLTPGSLWPVVLCLNPKMHQRLPDHQIKVAMDLREIGTQAAESHSVALEVLRERGLPKRAEKDLVEQAQQNILKMAQRKKFGDYTVIHPKTGTVLKYEREISNPQGVALMDQIRVSGISRLEVLDLRKQFPEAAFSFEEAGPQDSQHGELATAAVLIGLSVVGIRVLAAWLLKHRKGTVIEKTIEIIKPDGTRRTEHVIIKGEESKSEAAVIQALGKLTAFDISKLAS